MIFFQPTNKHISNNLNLPKEFLFQSWKLGDTIIHWFVFLYGKTEHRRQKQKQLNLVVYFFVW